MKIYTKTGDEGDTGLLGGVRVSKSSLAIEVGGCLDETNSLIGLALSHLTDLAETGVTPMLTQIQSQLFDLGSRVAACRSDTAHVAEFPESRVEQLEIWIDRSQERLPPMTHFVLPGGSTAAATLHLARSVSRRAERGLVALIESGVSRDLKLELIYLNRLSDLLFVIARLVNLLAVCPETKWEPTGKAPTG